MHAGLAICLVGLIGSSMYVTEVSDHVQYDKDADTGEPFTIGSYELDYTANSAYMTSNYTAVIYQVEFDLKQGDTTLGHMTPALKLIANTQQTQAVAAVHTTPLEDVFIIYNGVDDDDNFSLSVYINRLILFVWIGFGVMIVGALIAAFGKGRSKLAPAAPVAATAGDVAAAGNAAGASGADAADGQPAATAVTAPVEPAGNAAQDAAATSASDEAAVASAPDAAATGAGSADAADEQPEPAEGAEQG